MITDDELQRLSQSLHDTYGPDISQAACMAHLHQSLVGALCSAQGVNASALLAWQDRMLSSHLAHHGLCPEAVERARADLARCGAVVASINAIPD